MAQSNESNLRGLEFFWNNSSNENQHDWERWAEKFQLTIIAKDSVDIEDVINPLIRDELIYPMAEPLDPSEDQTRRAEQEERHRVAVQNYNEELRRRRAEDNAKFNGLQIGDIDKKLKSQLYLALGKEGQKCFSHKNPGKKILDINFAEFWELLKTTFTITTNLTYERFKFFGRRQKEHESLEKFHEILSELAKNCKLGELESELVRDIFITNMRNVEIQKKLCIEYLTPENVLSYVLVHEKGTKIHQQYLKFPTYNPGPRSQYVKNEPTLNIVENKKCRNCGQQFKKGHLSTCQARDRNCNTCGRKGHFAKHCRSSAKTQTNIVDQNRVPQENENVRANPQENPEFEVNLDDFLVLVIDTDNQINAVEDKIERGVRTVFNHEGLELKKTLKVALGKFNPYYTEIQIDSASPVSFMKKDLLHELKIRDRFVKLEPVDEITKKAYQGFGSTINIIGKVRVKIQSKGWEANDQKLFITEGAERNLLGNDILPNLGIVVFQKQPPPNGSKSRENQKVPPIGTNVNQIKFASDIQQDQNQETPSQREFKLYISKHFSDLIKRTGRSKNYVVNTYFNEPIKPIQVKGKRIPIHLLPKVKLCIDQLLSDGHIEKLSRCSEDCFISPIVITAKRDGSIKLALNSKLLNKQIFRNRYQMPNLFELIDNVAVTISGHDQRNIWFSSIDLKYAYSQIPLSKKASNQYNFNIVGGEVTGSYRFKTGFYGLGDTPNEFQRIMDRLTEKLPNTHCYLDDILIATVGSEEEHKKLVINVLKTLDDEGLAIKWEKCTFLTHNIEWLGFRIDAKGTTPLIHKSDAFRNLQEPNCIKDIRSLMGSINQFNKFIPNLASLSTPFRELMQKNKPFKWSTVHTEAFEKIKNEICNTVTNHHFDVKLNTRVKCDASHLGLGASIEQDHWGNWKTVAFASRFLNIAELKYSTNELELLGLVWALDHFKNYLLGKQFSILTDHKALIGALKDDKYTKTAQSRLTRWADKLLPFDFTVEHLPGKDMGFVDYISRHPSGEPVPVSLDDEKFVIASVNQISTLLGFDHLMPKNSWAQIRNKFSQHFLADDVTSCNAIGQSTDHMTSQEIEREKRIANAAEIFQAISNHSNISVCQNSHSRTELCDSSCKINDFFTNFKILKEMAEQIEFNQQKELSTKENTDVLTPNTSNPSDKPENRSPSKKKNS